MEQNPLTVYTSEPPTKISNWFRWLLSIMRMMKSPNFNRKCLNLLKQPGFSSWVPCISVPCFVVCQVVQLKAFWTSSSKPYGICKLFELAYWQSRMGMPTEAHVTCAVIVSWNHYSRNTMWLVHCFRTCFELLGHVSSSSRCFLRSLKTVWYGW